MTRSHAHDPLAPARDASAFYRALVDLTGDLARHRRSRRPPDLRQRAVVDAAALRRGRSAGPAALIDLVREDARDEAQRVLLPPARRAACPTRSASCRSWRVMATSVWAGVRARLTNDDDDRRTLVIAARDITDRRQTSRTRCARATRAIARRSTRTSPASTSSRPPARCAAATRRSSASTAFPR